MWKNGKKNSFWQNTLNKILVPQSKYLFVERIHYIDNFSVYSDSIEFDCTNPRPSIEYFYISFILYSVSLKKIVVDQRTFARSSILDTINVIKSPLYQFTQNSWTSSTRIGFRNQPKMKERTKENTYTQFNNSTTFSITTYLKQRKSMTDK